MRNSNQIVSEPHGYSGYKEQHVGDPVPATARGRVLVVDDDPGVRALMASVLTDEGYTVLEAADGDEALALLWDAGAGPLDMVLLDLMMPGMSGWSFLERHRNTRPPVPAVIVATALDPRGVRLPKNVGAVLRKPFQIDALLALVARFIRPAGAVGADAGSAS